MDVIALTQEKLESLPEFQVSNIVKGTEGKFLLYEENGKKELLKLYYDQSQENINAKVCLMTWLLNALDKKEYPEFHLFDGLVITDEVKGCKIPLIENGVNLQILLRNPKVKLSQKISYLKEILEILLKSMNIPQLANTFFLGDISESKFIFDFEEMMIKAIGLDSGYIKGLPVSPSKVLSDNPYLQKFSKYQTDNDKNIIPNQNSIYTSFIYMLLNTLSGESDSHQWEPDKFFRYISFLENRKIDLDLIAAIISIYRDKTNIPISLDMLNSINCSKDYSLSRLK